jgi:hypothetical protein
MQAEVVLHMHSEKWAYASQECTACKGTGKIAQKGVDPIKCSDCNGQGRFASSPYAAILVQPAGVDSQAAPIPPAGYIVKPTDIVKIQDVRIDNHIYHALSAINMEFLTETPLAISGEAKQVDRDELNVFVNSIAEDLVWAVDQAIFYINEYRYALAVADKTKRADMLPNISVPERFDLLNSQFLITEFNAAKTAQLNPELLNQMEIELAAKRFQNTPKVRDKLISILALDPFANMSSEEITFAQSNGLITKVDAVISSNIANFVNQAVDEDPEFFDKPLAERRKVMETYANKIIEENDAAAELKAQALGGTPPANDPAVANKAVGVLDKTDTESGSN